MADKDFKIRSIEDISKPGAKPAIGISADPFSQPLYQYDETGRVIGKRDFGGSGISKAQREQVTDPEKARVGDYYYDLNGNLNVVPNSPTDIFNKWKITEDTSLYEKPTLDTGRILETMASPILSTIGGATGAGIGGAIAKGVGAKAAAGAIAGGAGGLLSFLAIGGVLSAQQVGAQEKAYREALKDWQKSQEKAIWKVAGNLSTDEKGKVTFTPDPSKAITMNTAFAGSEIQKAFNTDTNVYFGEDGRLKVEVNPIFAATDQYSQMIDIIKKGYSGLTKDTENADQYVEEIKNYITNANNQFKFREQSLYSYKTQLPDAPDDVIEDAYTNEIGAYMSEKDGADYDVKVYRNGEIKTETAQKVLEDFYNKDLGQRSDYMLDLFAKMDDPTMPVEDKVYVLSEIKMLTAADANDQKYDNGQKDDDGNVVKTTNKYFGMLDQESIISALNNWSLVGGVSVIDAINFLDAITPWNMHISDQRGLQEDPAAASAARLISTATSALTAYLAMQGIEHGVIRPLAAKLGESVSSGFSGILEKIAARGDKFSEIVGGMQLANGFAAEEGNLIAQWVQGARLASSPMIRALGFSISELLYNATSDLVFDAAKQGVKALAGEEPTGEEFLEEFGVDLVMDLIMQYGPAGLAQARSALDNYRLEAVYAPYKEGLEYAQQQFDSAELEYESIKQEVADMRKDTKNYREKSADLETKRQEYERAKANYEKLRTEVDTAIKESMPTASEELGAALAGKMSELEQNNIVMWLRKKFTDEKAGLSVLAEQAYNKTKDVYLYAAAVNKFQSIQAGIKEVSTKMLAMDAYAKGTSESYRGFADAVQAAAPNAKFSKTQIEYLVAKAEYDAWSMVAADNADVLAKVEEKYLPYINKVQGEEATQLNQVLESTKNFLKKVGESYIKSDAATKKQVKDIETAALGVNYIPLWGKGAKTQQFGIFETPLTLRVGRTFDPEEGLYDVEGIRNPVESALAYTHNVINNIARNEMAAMLKEVASIDGLGVELVGEGAKDAKPEFQDIIEESRNNVAKSKEQMLTAEVKPEEYASGLEKVLSNNDNDIAIKGIDSLIKKQSNLQKLIEGYGNEGPSTPNYSRISVAAQKDALSAIPEELQVAWYMNGDRSAREKIANIVESNVELRNAGLNRFYEDYVYWQRTLGSKPLPFDKWLNSNIALYRYSDPQLDAKSKTLSYSVVPGGLPLMGGELQMIVVKPLDTLGKTQTTGTATENEVFVRKNIADKNKPKTGSYEKVINDSNVLSARNSESALAKRAMTSRMIDVWTSKDFSEGDKVFLSNREAIEEFGRGNIVKQNIPIDDIKWSDIQHGKYSPVTSISKITKLNAEIKKQKVQVRSDIDMRIRSAGEYFNKTYKKYGITVDIDNYLTSAKYTKMIDGKLNSLSVENLIALKDDIAKTINQVAPYLSLKKIDQKVLNKEIKELKVRTRERLDKEHPEYSAKKKYAIVGQTVDNFRAQLAGDYGMVYDDPEITTQGAYKIPFTSEGKDASFYIKGKLAREVAAEMTTKNISDRRVISEFFKEAANIKRLLTTGIDPTRVLPNLVRDTIRNGIMSGGTDYWFFDNSPFGFTQMFTKMARSMGDTDEQIGQALNTLKASQEIVSGATYNEAINGRRTNSVKRLVESSTAVGDNRGVKFIWELAHDKKGLLSAPMNWAEGLTRDRAAASAFMRAYMRGGEGLSYEARLNNAYEAGLNAGRENTMNFLRRGTFINEIASYVPYLSQKFSSIESAKIAFLKDPVGVSSRIMMFGAAYMIELSRVLSDEKSRKNYYNLSEYDRENNIILSLGNGNLVTIPLDDTVAAIIYPWRRGLETLYNVDPQSFYMIMVNGFLELSPFDLSGFTEGDSFNFGRGLEKLGGQVLPTLMQFAYTQASGRNMYYGSQVEITADSLAEYGNYSPTPGDFTTTGKNSQLLRHIADALGIEQWRLQQAISDLGGNVGQYVVNWLDKVAGAPEDAQGGKDFMDATFKSFTGMDSTQVQYAFNDGINELIVEKEKVKSKLSNLNKQISLASGTRLAELQEEYRGVKQDFAMKVGNFIDKYINAYEIAGGLSKDQANKIWYLLNFADDDSLAMANSVESYYRDLAKKQANNDATSLSAGILDKYYDQTKNVYKDSSGKWHYYSPYGEQAFFNTVQGRGMEYQIGLRNLIEGDLSTLASERSAAYDAREAAAEAKNWDEYDRIGLVFDDKIIDAISPYVKRYGAENVLTNSSVLDYLEEWFFVPTSYMKSKYGKNVSLAHNASKQRAFVRPYIKDLFGVNTGYTESNYISRPENLVRGGK